MKSAPRSAHRFTLLFFACVFGALNCAGRSPVAAAPPDATEANITRLTAGILESSQLAHHPLDKDLAGTFLDNYLDALDGTHSLFLKSDVDEFAAYRATLAQTTRATGDTGAARAIFKRFLERVHQRSAFVAETLKAASFDFTGHDTFSADRQHAPRPRDAAEARALWRAQLSAEYLQEKLADTPPPQIAKKLTRRYAQQAETMKGLNNEEVLEIYLNSLAHVYDPHSDYMSHGQLEGFSISMNLSLFGIGAALENNDGYCTVRETIAGGPAARSGALKPGDRIVAVAQAGKEPVDIVNMPLSRAVELIRGPKGSRVTLTILPAGAQEGAPPTQVALVRDKIQLEDQAAKARVIDLPRANGGTLRLGVIDLPGFYANMGENAPEQHSATADVAKLIQKLKREKVQGIALDLRHNGGGSLTEAITLTGLFINKGPVVQTRGAAGEVDVQTDPDSSVLYDGPLVLLTSRFSASATEILAGALQDYGRAVVIGDSQTFGKGTVQSVLPLAPVMDKNGLAHRYDPGALKVTVSMFYRPSGASTQLRGVASDIVLPSTSDFSEVSESALDNALPWGSVKAASFERMNRVAPYLATLRERSSQRIASAPEFAELAGDVQRVKKSLSEKTVSLNETERRAEMAENKARKEQRERAAAARRSAQPVTYEVTLKNAGSPGLTRMPAVAPAADPQAAHNANPPQSSKENDEVAAQKADDDTLLNETVKILADYTELLRGPAKSGEPARAVSR